MSTLMSGENQEVGQRLLDLLRQVRLRTMRVEELRKEVKNLYEQKIYTSEEALQQEKEISSKEYQIDVEEKAIRSKIVRVCIIIEHLGIEI